MVTAFDRVVISVPHLPQAVRDYSTVLEAEALWLRDERGGQRAWFGLRNTVLEINEGTGEAAITALVLAHQALPAAPASVYETAGGPLQEVLCPCPNTRNLSLFYSDAQATRQFRLLRPTCQSDSLWIDHVVLQTGSADDCVALFRDQLGIRLALDKSAPEWGGRMLFFRSGKLTLEVIESQATPPPQDYFWGVAYQCQDIERQVQRMRAASVTVSDVRDGRKPGTRVATLKSHMQGIPSLLVQP